MNDMFQLPGKRREIPPELEARIDQVAGEAGFISRDGLKPVPRRRRGTKAQLHNFTMRLEVDDAERFIRYCEQERIAYREAFKRMLDQTIG